MRFLLTVIPGFGHFHPLEPLAQALKDAGHQITIVTANAFADVSRDAGFETVGAGLDWHESRLAESLPEIANVPLSRRGEFLMKEIFLKRSPARLYPDLLRAIDELKPDALLHGNLEFATPLAAAKTNLPIITISYAVRWTKWTLKLVAGRAVGELRKRFGLPADPDFHDFARDLEISVAPPSWSLNQALLRPQLTRLVLKRVLWSDLPATQRAAGARALVLQRLLAIDHLIRRPDDNVLRNVVFIRPVNADAEPDALPQWRRDLPDQPTVYASLGTVFGNQHPEVFRTLASAFHDAPVNLVLSLGGVLEPGALGSQPKNVHVERFFTQRTLAALLPTMELSINHAGYSSVMEAASRGLPMVLLPLTADQPIISQMCFANGIAVGLPAYALGLSARGLPVVQPERLTPELVRRAVEEALGNHQYHTNARIVRNQLTSLPQPEAAVRKVEEIAARGRTAAA